MNGNLINRLTKEDAISPEVMFGHNYIPLNIKQGSLPPARESKIEEILASLYHNDLPDWTKGFSPYSLREAQELFQEIPSIRGGQEQKYKFNLNRRIDEFTFIGDVVGDKIPVLAIQLSDSVLSDKTGNVFIDHIRWYIVGNIPPNPTPDEFKIRLVTREYFGDTLTHHTPELMLAETWRVVSVYEKLSVGTPAGSVTLIPGESRSIDITRRNKSVLTIDENIIAIEQVTDKTTHEFTNNYTELAKASSDLKTKFTWSNVLGITDKPLTKQESSTEKSQTVLNSLDITVNTIDKTNKDITRYREVTITNDYNSVTEEETTDVRKVTIKNDTGQCVTYVYHYLDKVYLICIDIVRIKLIYTGKTVDSMLRHIDISDNFNDELKTILVDESHIHEVRLSIDNVLRERYSQLDLIKESDSGAVLKPSLDKDINTNIHSRQALFGERRTSGPLPVNLSTTRVAVQTSNLHAVPHLAEFSLPSIDIGKKIVESE